MRWTVCCFAIAAGLLPSMDAQQAAPREKVPPKPLRVQLRLDGLYPKTMTVEEGTYEIVMENGVFTSQVDFQLRNEGGQELGKTNAASLTKGKFRGRQRLELDLKPGKHEIQVVGQPNWKIELTVVPRR